MPATSTPAIAPATSTAPIETHQRIAVLPSFQGDGDTHKASRKAGTCIVLHIPVSCVGLAEFTDSVASLDDPLFLSPFDVAGARGVIGINHQYSGLQGLVISGHASRLIDIA